LEFLHDNVIGMQLLFNAICMLHALY